MNNNKTIIEPTNKHYTININSDQKDYLDQSPNTHKYYDLKWPMHKQLENSLVGLGRFSNIMSHILKCNYIRMICMLYMNANITFI